MTEQQWEFCELGLVDWKERQKGRNYKVYVDYYGPEYRSHYSLAKIDEGIWEFSPFDEAMRLLGAAGWELVSHQYASAGQWVGFHWGQRVAMFKRPVQEGRAVDEPKLIGIIKP